jgi:HAE1 family hydrophobic/amphiphilic exporter-1
MRSTRKKIPAKERNVSDTELAALLSEELSRIPEIIPYISNSNDIEGAPLSFTLQSESQLDLKKADEMIKTRLQGVEEIMNYESSYRDGAQIIHIQPRQWMLAELGTSPLELAMHVRSSINGIKASVLRENGKEYDIIVSYPGDEVNSLEKIRQIPVLINGNAYTIEQLADLSLKTSQAQIQHLDKRKTVNFALVPPGNVVAGDARKVIEKVISETNLPESVSFSWSGNIKEMDETVNDMIITFLIAILLMYMLLASLLENFWHPFIIFTTVPMAMIGVFLFMYIGGTTMNMMSLMAIITLLGLVVNDDILIHDYTEQLREKGLRLKEATLKAGKTKMKTVIMTTVAIVAGMLPNAMGLGDAGAAYRSPMGVVTIGGILTSTILTLYLIPSLFYTIRNRKSNRHENISY